MSKIILICISGTGQDTTDSSENAIDNPLKIALRCGWKGYDVPSEKNNQYVIYVPGIGTLDSQRFIDEDDRADASVKTTTNAAFAPNNIIAARQAYIQKKLEEADYQPGDEICIVGFSSGASESRILASNLSDKNIPIHLLCCFDIVTKIGRPDKNTWSDNGLSFEKNVATKSVKKTILLVSINENRPWFPPIVMDYDENRVHEVWFAGVHSDIGGGYAEHKHSDVTLDYMIEQMTQAGITVKQPSEVELPSGFDIKDIASSPNPLGKIHHHKVAEGSRSIRVIDGGKPSDKTPHISQSVKKRIDSGSGNYNIGSTFNWNFV